MVENKNICKLIWLEKYVSRIFIIQKVWVLSRQTGWIYHIIKKNCYPSSVGVFCDKVCDHLKSFIYSSMKSLCEIRKEFLVSKLMFEKILNTKRIKDILVLAFIDSVESFVISHIEAHASHFCFYLRFILKHYKEYINVIQERTNCALKYASAPVGPNTKIKNP